ncbi:MAG: hypothetical protein GY864_12370 [Desulfobacterales bacterium]|nr:hypothetical protein [Desulfobacterales bacterium]
MYITKTSDATFKRNIMTRGGFKSTVRIIKTWFSGRFVDGIPRVFADMELGGKLLVFNYGNLRERITPDTKAEVSVEIEFRQDQEIPVEAENERESYIGTIRLSDYSQREADSSNDLELSVIVRINLPIDMFYQLSLWEGKAISFETIHDIIKNPTEDQKLDHVVAFVKRVHFETTAEPPPEKKRWLLGTK